VRVGVEVLVEVVGVGVGVGVVAGVGWGRQPLVLPGAKGVTAW
jgi:hypothetical protein